jgi:hypothetical protein
MTNGYLRMRRTLISMARFNIQEQRGAGDALADPSAAGLDCGGGQPANLTGGFVLIEEINVVQCAAQELLGQFARSNNASQWPCGD